MPTPQEILDEKLKEFDEDTERIAMNIVYQHNTIHGL